MYSVALAMGLSCGAGCGSISTPFLTAYVLGREKGLKSSFLITLIFSLGKIIIMGVLGGLSAYLASTIITKGMILFGLDITKLFSILTLIIGIYLIITSLKSSSKQKKCSSCVANNSCKSRQNYNPTKSSYSKNITLKEFALLFFAGVFYGITPCVPLITMLATATTLTVLEGVLLLSFFGFVTCITPSIIQNIIAGYIAPKMKKELENKYKYITIIAGVILIITSIRIII